MPVSKPLRIQKENESYVFSSCPLDSYSVLPGALSVFSLLPEEFQLIYPHRHSKQFFGNNKDTRPASHRVRNQIRLTKRVLVSLLVSEGEWL